MSMHRWVLSNMSCLRSDRTKLQIKKMDYVAATGVASVILFCNQKQYFGRLSEVFIMFNIMQGVGLSEFIPY